MQITGQCLCGAVRFSGNAEPVVQVKCYCSDCRKTSASGHAAMMGFPKGVIQLTGEVKAYRSKADSGAEVTRAFCPTCGAGVCSSNSTMTELIFLRASILDDPGIFVPQLVVYASRAPAWDPVSQSVPACAEEPLRG